MDKIILNGCRFYGYHGAFAEEQTLGQIFVVDLELAVDLTKASQSDNLDDTVHYGLVFEAVQKQVEDKKYILIERLAGAICEDLFAQFPPIQSIKVKAVSSYYETAAWGLTDQADFLNLALALETKLPAETLLRSCQQIEKDLDRVRHEHWGPRTVDIDILLYGQEIWETEHLKVPHPYMSQRAFVLVPLVEIPDDLVDPKTGQAYKNYLSQLNTSDVRKLELMD